MSYETNLTAPTDTRAAIELVTNSLTSEHSKRAYSKALSDFFRWREENGNPPLTKGTGHQYKQMLTGSPASINLNMSAIRTLAQEASDNGLLDAQIANGVRHVSGVSSHGVRSGSWLTKQQAQDILLAPEISTLKGLRVRAILAVMIGAGLRRSEVAAIRFDHIQQPDGRWVIIDIVGKAIHVRTISISSWVKLAIDEWSNSAGVSTGLVFSAMHKGGSGLDQIQLSLGQLSIKTTEKYLGISLNLTDAPCGHLGLSLE